jgi:hypothetical protein
VLVETAATLVMLNDKLEKLVESRAAWFLIRGKAKSFTDSEPVNGGNFMTHGLGDWHRSKLFHDLIAQQLVVSVLSVLHLVAIGREKPLKRLSNDQK